MNNTKKFALTGMPRSGTTYLAAVLYNPPQVITISEAKGRWKQEFQVHGKGGWVFQVFDEYRDNILQGKAMHTFEGTPGFAGHTRIDTWNQKKVMRPLDADADFVLGMKNPEIFLELLGTFQQSGMKCVITVRHPSAIINSWVKKGKKRQERGKSTQGSFANGESISYQSKLSEIVERRIDLHNYFARQIIHHKNDPNVMLIRYEDWFTDPQQLSRTCKFLDIPSIGYLRPAPLLPEPLLLSQDEQEQILQHCTIAEEFGYPVQNHRLEPENLPAKKDTI